ncbi:hypothetical protein D3C84_908800 [compost metagenome]
MHGNRLQARDQERLGARPVAEMSVKRFAGAGAVESRLAPALIGQPAFKVLYQRLPGPPSKPFRLYIAEGDPAADRGHGNADGLVLQQGDIEV